MLSRVARGGRVNFSWGEGEKTRNLVEKIAEIVRQLSRSAFLPSSFRAQHDFVHGDPPTRFETVTSERFKSQRLPFYALMVRDVIIFRLRIAILLEQFTQRSNIPLCRRDFFHTQRSTAMHLHACETAATAFTSN